MKARPLRTEATIVLFLNRNHVPVAVNIYPKALPRKFIGQSFCNGDDRSRQIAKHLLSGHF